MSDTGSIRDDERFDEARVTEYLRGAVPGLEGPVEFTQFHGGHANLTYLVRSGDTEYVLRRPPLGEVPKGAHDMARESRVLSVLHEPYPLAPRAVHLCEDPDVMGKPFFVMERRTGAVVRGRWPDELPAGIEAKRAVGEAFVDALAALHQVDFAAIGLADLGRPDGFAERQVEGWARRWERARHDEVPDMERLAQGLMRSIPNPQRASLLHGDFKLDNTMVSADGDLVAVFDWDMATLGDPLVDVGTTLSYFDGPPEVEIIVPPDRKVLDEAISVDDVMARYAAATGLDLSQISWYRALGAFRVAVIIQQIHIRFVRGQTADNRFAVLGSVVPPLAAAGLAHVG